MYECFIFETTLTTEMNVPIRGRCVIVFCAYANVTIGDICAALKSFMETSTIPNNILFLGTSAQQGNIELLVKDRKIFEHLPSLERSLNPPELVGVIRSHTSTKCIYQGQWIPFDRPIFFDAIRQEGMLSIFRARKGMFDTNGLFHYVKPSQQHSDRFIRTATVLVRGAEVRFIAFWLLDFIFKRVIKHVYTDSASIDTLAYAMYALAKEISPDVQAPTIDSFGSYEGLKDFVLESNESALTLVSASTSGSLVKKLREANFFSEIVTIYYLGVDAGNSIVLCDLGKHTANLEAYEPIPSHSAGECPFCLRQIPIINIFDEQFIPQSPNVIEEMITKEDAPSWLNSFMPQFCGTGILKAYYGEAGSADRVRDIYIDVAEMLLHYSDKPLVKRLKQVIHHGISINIRRIIVLEDEGSHAIGKLIKEIVKGREIDVLSSAQLHIDKIALKETTLVVSAVLISGRRIMSISQQLRGHDEAYSIQYLVGIARCRSEARHIEIKRNIQFGSSRADHYPYNAVQTIQLPDDAPSVRSPWDVELELLVRISEFNDDAKRAVSERLQELRTAGQTKGLSDNIFLSFKDKKLKLRPGFAFYDFPYSASSQADVFFVITAVLHNMRTRQKPKPKLQQDCVRTVISPRCFDRFNDGVVQSALLRAAYPAELDYSINGSISEEMKRILQFIFKNCDNDMGEASLEFLFALATQKLKLQTKHIKEIIDSIKMEHALGVLFLLIIKNEYKL